MSPQVRHFVPYFACVALSLLLFFTILPLARRDDSATAKIDPQNYSLSLSTPQSTNLSINPSSSGAVGIAENSISVTANSPSGYTLYIATNKGVTDNKIYLEGATTKDNTNTINATTGTFASPAALDNNSWGYAVANVANFDATYDTTSPSADAKFAAMPLYANVDHDTTQAIKHKTASAITPETTTVYLGTKANMTLTPGDYTTTLSYLVIGHLVDSASTNGEIDIAEGETTIPGDYSNKTIHLTTSLSTNFYLGDVAVNLTKGSNTSSCTDISITTQNPLTLSCKLPSGLEVGAYDVTIETGIWSHTETSLFTIKNFFTIQYDGNKPSGVTADVVNIPSTSGEDSDDPSVTEVDVDIEGMPTLAGYDFLGYAEKSGSTIPATPTYVFNSDDSTFNPSYITIEANNPVTLYAIWQKQVMTFDKAFAAAGKTDADKATAVDGKKYYKMQDMTNDICNDVTTGVSNDGNDTQVAQLIDTRDSKVYWVAKLKTAANGSTGECWMTQNLDLDLATNKTLTSADTDVTDDYTPNVNTTTGNTFNSSDYVGQNSYDGGTYYWNGTWNSSSQNNNAGYSFFANYFKTTLAESGAAEHYHVGNLYQWSAATAGTGDGLKSGADATSSICPKGWRLPYSGDNTSDRTFGKMLTAYGYSSWSDKKTITKDPLYFVPAGYVYSGKLYLGAYRGYYWSSRAYSTTNTDYAYGLIFVSSSVLPSSSNYRYLGYSVRCVAR